MDEEGIMIPVERIKQSGEISSVSQKILCLL